MASRNRFGARTQSEPCAECDDIPTSLTMVTGDDSNTCVALYLCADCAPKMARNAIQTRTYGKWPMGCHRLTRRPRKLVTDMRWKGRPTLESEVLVFIMKNLTSIPARDVHRRLSPALKETLVNSFVKSNVRLSKSFAEVLRGVAFRPLPVYKFSSMKLNDAELRLASYCAGLDDPATEALELAWNTIGNRTAAVLGSLCTQVQFLQRLDVSWSKFPVQGLSLFCNGLQHCVSLTDVNLSGNGFPASCGKPLGQVLKHNTTLLSLNVGFNELRREGATWLSEGLDVNLVLTELNIRNNSIGREGATAIAEALQPKEYFKNLVLADNSIGRQGAGAIASTQLPTFTLVRGLMPGFDKDMAHIKRPSMAAKARQQAEAEIAAEMASMGSGASAEELERRMSGSAASERGQGAGTGAGAGVAATDSKYSDD